VSLASVASVIGGTGPARVHGVRVNCVSPYAVPTELSMPHLPQGARADDALKNFFAFVGGEANLKGVDAVPKDVANAVLYLASDEARYVSALNLVVDGGFTSVNHNLRAFEDYPEVVSRVMPVHNALLCYHLPL
jgi:xanthoxin dehydrogenase